jgi:hypothetical protein
MYLHALSSPVHYSSKGLVGQVSFAIRAPKGKSALRGAEIAAAERQRRALIFLRYRANYV